MPGTAVMMTVPTALRDGAITSVIQKRQGLRAPARALQKAELVFMPCEKSRGLFLHPSGPFKCFTQR